MVFIISYCNALITRETQIKPLMSYHLTPARMTIIEKTRDDK